MKREILLLTGFIVLTINLFSQDYNVNFILKITDSIAQKLGKEILEKQVKIMQQVPKSDLYLNLKFDFIKNNKNEITKLSVLLTNNLTVKLNSYLNQNLNALGAFKGFNCYTEQIVQTKFHYTVQAKYILTDSSLTIFSIKFVPSKNVKNNLQFTFKDILIKDKNFRSLKSLNISTTNLQFKKFVNYLKTLNNNNIISEAFLANYNEKYIEQQDEVFGKLIKVEFNKDYDLQIKLNIEAFVYGLFYDPMENKIILFYPTDDYSNNAILSKSEYFLTTLSFYKTGMDSEYAYLFLIGSVKKIPIFDFFEKIPDGSYILFRENDIISFINFLKAKEKYLDAQTIIIQFIE